MSKKKGKKKPAPAYQSKLDGRQSNKKVGKKK